MKLLRWPGVGRTEDRMSFRPETHKKASGRRTAARVLTFHTARMAGFWRVGLRFPAGEPQHLLSFVTDLFLYVQELILATFHQLMYVSICFAKTASNPGCIGIPISGLPFRFPVFLDPYFRLPIAEECVGNRKSLLPA